MHKVPGKSEMVTSGTYEKIVKLAQNDPKLSIKTMVLTFFEILELFSKYYVYAHYPLNEIVETEKFILHTIAHLTLYLPMHFVTCALKIPSEFIDY